MLALERVDHKQIPMITISHMELTRLNWNIRATENVSRLINVRHYTIITKQKNVKTTVLIVYIGYELVRLKSKYNVRFV